MTESERTPLSIPGHQRHLAVLSSQVDLQPGGVRMADRGGDGLLGETDEDEQVAFIRLAQEAVTNTVRHSYATRLQIDLACEDGQVTLVARDDGVGAHTSELGNGLQGLRERFEDLGGELTVDGRHGFAVTGRLVST